MTAKYDSAVETPLVKLGLTRLAVEIAKCLPGDKFKFLAELMKLAESGNTLQIEVLTPNFISF